MEITLKTLVITFNDDTTDADVADVMEYLLNYKGGAVFTVQSGTEVEAVIDDVFDDEDPDDISPANIGVEDDEE